MGDNNNLNLDNDNSLMMESETIEDNDNQLIDNSSASFINCSNDENLISIDNEDEGDYQQIENKCTCGSYFCKTNNLCEQLDLVLGFDVGLKSQGKLDRLLPFLTNRQMDIQSYLKLLNEYRIEHHCATTWAPNYIAYRCRTCSNSYTMSLCFDCFHNGDHEGHDYNMFKSRSGGACDCGNSVVKDIGHCKRHGKNAQAKRKDEEIPKNLICIPKRSMPRLLNRLAIFLRTSIDITSEIELYLDFLSKLINSSAIMRSLMIDALLSEKAYTSQIRLFRIHRNKHYNSILEDSLKALKRGMKNLMPFKVPENWNSTASKIINRKGDCKSFIDEFIFWIIHFEFPQKLACFFMSFLMDDNYKQTFSKLYVQYYPRMLMVMIAPNVESSFRQQSRESYELLTRRMLQVSVQIYMDKSLTRKLCEEEYVLHSLIYCLKVAIEGLPESNIKGTLKKNPLCTRKFANVENRRANVVSCDNVIIRDRNLVPFIEDLNEILDSEYGVERLLLDKELCKIWLGILVNFQTLCFYKRELLQHAPYESYLYIAPFTVESDFCMNPLFIILNVLKSNTPKNIALVKSLLQSIHTNLANWIYHMGFSVDMISNPYILNFHIPVHRMFGATLRHLLFVHNVPEQEVYELLYYSQIRNRSNITLVEFLKILLSHPMQALSLYHQVRNNMWTRNGLLTINQAATYVHGAYCNCTIDIDMFLLRYNASKLCPNYLLKSLMLKFNVWKWLSYKTNEFLINDSQTQNSLYDFMMTPEQSLLNIESALAVIIQMLTLSIHCDISEINQIRQELIAIISVSDRPYSYLYNMLPDRLNNLKLNYDDKNFSTLLKDLATFKPAQHGTNGQLQQGYYSLKPSTWQDEYDPIFVQYRFYQKRDCQASLERFFNYARSKGLLENRYNSSALFPPLKVPKSEIAKFGNLDLTKILESQTLVGIIYAIIYKHIYIVELPDVIISYTIYLLELSMRKYLMKDIFDKNNINPLFTGKYYFGQLFSNFDNFNSSKQKATTYRGNSILASNIDHSSMNKQNSKEYNNSNKLFPIVKDALDLNFETTWFPFTSIVDNLLVFIDDVHSMRAKEFKLRLNEVNFENADIMKNLDPETSSSEFMSWSNDDKDDDEEDDHENDDEDEEEEDEDDNDDDDDDDDGDDDDDNSDSDDVGDIGDVDDMRNFDFLNTFEEILYDTHDSITTIGQVRVIGELPNDTTDSDSEIIGLIRHPTTQAAVDTPHNLSSNLNRNTSNVSNNSNLNLNPHRPTSDSNNQRSINTNQHEAGYLQREQRPFHSTVSSARTDNNNTTSNQQRIEYQSIRDNQIELSNSVENNSDVDMTSINLDDNTTRVEQQQQHSSPTITTLNTSLTNSNSNSNNNNNSVTQLQQQQQQRTVGERTVLNENNDNNTSNTTLPNHIRRVIDDHNYSHNYIETSMEVDSLPEIHSTALSLIPINEHLVRANNVQAQAQLYPENLVTERRAILASELGSRSSTRLNQQPLALQVTSGSASYNDHRNEEMRDLRDQRRQQQLLLQQNLQDNSSTQANNITSGDPLDRTLSEFDIQARFTGFFHQSREDSRPSFVRGARMRPQLARRGGFRNVSGAPFAVHNPNNNSRNTQQPTAGANAVETNQQQQQPATSNNTNRPPRQRQTARRSNFGAIISNRVLASRDYIVRDYIQHVEPEVQRSLVFYKEKSSRKGSKSSSVRSKRYEKMNHAECLLSLLLRLHSKYCQKERSYQFDEMRAKENKRADRTRIGDGAHFVTIVLDLICISNEQAREGTEYLQKLIWNNNKTSDRKKVFEQEFSCASKSEKDIKTKQTFSSPTSTSTSSEDKKLHQQTDHDSSETPPAAAALKTEVVTNTSQRDNSTKIQKNTSTKASSCLDSNISANERRRRAKEYQSKLMAEFAKKQNAFIEKYEFTSSRQVAHASGIASSINSKSSISSAAQASSLSSSAGQGMGGVISGQASAAAGTVGTASSSTSSPTKTSLYAGDKAGAVAAGPAAPSMEPPLLLTSCPSPNDEPINLSSKSSSIAYTTKQPSCHGDYDKKEQQKQQLAGCSSSSSSLGGGGSIDKKNLNHNEDNLQTTFASAGPFPAGSYNAEKDKHSHDCDGDDDDDDDNNDNSPIYECCICGVEGPSDLANPLGQVVLLQSTSIYGHSHMRPKHERCLPCDEFEFNKLKGETYAKYLERRIDLLCENFTEKSWLDSINIGAEGGVHVQSCGHYLHIECYQSYIKSLDQEDRLRGGTSGSDSRNDSDEFLCPVCRQLANSVLPILVDKRRQPSKPLSLNRIESKFLNYQITLIGSYLKQPKQPNQKELQPSASFCSHLTKATGPQYRLVRSSASMHSLFLFLTSIARTNLETEVIIRLSANKITTTTTTNMTNSTEASTSKSTSGSGVKCSTTGGTTPFSSELSSRRSCFQLLFHVLALNAQTLINEQWFTYDQIWSYLTQSFNEEKDRLCVKPMNSEVPLLLRDPTAMLLQFLFSIINSLSSKDNFTCVVKILFNLTVIQSIALVLSYVKPSFIFERSSSSTLLCDTNNFATVHDDDKMATNEQEMETEQHYETDKCYKFRSDLMDMKKKNKKQEQEQEEDCDEMEDKVKLNWKEKGNDDVDDVDDDDDESRISTAYQFATNDFERLVVFVGSNLTRLLANPTHEPLMNSRVRKCWARFSHLEGEGEGGENIDNNDRGIDSKSNITATSGKQFELIENRVKLACLPFLRACSLIQHHLYNETFPVLVDNIEQIDNVDEYMTKKKLIVAEFDLLTKYLGLNNNSNDNKTTSFDFDTSSCNKTTSEDEEERQEQEQQHDQEGSASSSSLLTRQKCQAGWKKSPRPDTISHLLNWPPAVFAAAATPQTKTKTKNSAGSAHRNCFISGEQLISSWCSELLHTFAREYSIAARTLLICRPLAWFRPSLMQLPRNFDDIFMHYYRKKCNLCLQIPKEVAVCLVCGALICFRVSCCKDRSISRKDHSQHCGSNTAVFLAIHTSAIVVIRGNRACVWGSVYLDAHDEEDNGLQRGKPLYLVDARYNLLERQWLTHSFDHTCSRKWVHLHDNQL